MSNAEKAIDQYENFELQYWIVALMTLFLSIKVWTVGITSLVSHQRWFSDRRFLDRKEGLVIGSAEEPRLKCGRRVFGRSQRRALNAAYHRDPRPSPAGHRHLSRQLGVPVFRIRVGPIFYCYLFLVNGIISP